MEINIETTATNGGTSVFLISFVGQFDQDAYETASKEFANKLKDLNGNPFRVLCDFTESSTMTPAESKVFMETQDLAVIAGMERDVFVSHQEILRMQLQRLARKGERLNKLGNLEFRDEYQEGLEFILA